MKYLSLIITPCIVLFLFPKIAHSAVSFTIQNPTIEGDYYIVDASISGITAQIAYVQGMFTATTSSSYFGFTWGQNEEWINYEGNTTKDFITQNLPILPKNVSQKIWIKPDYDASGYKGPGQYYLKLKRYTGASNNSTGEDAVLTVTLTQVVATPTPSPSPTPTSVLQAEQIPEPTPTSEPTWESKPTKTPTPTKKPTPILTPTVEIATNSMILGSSTESAEFSVASVSGETSPTPNQLSKSISKKTKNYKTPFFIGVLISIVSASVLYFRHKKD